MNTKKKDVAIITLLLKYISTFSVPRKKQISLPLEFGTLPKKNLREIIIKIQKSKFFFLYDKR